MEERLRAERPLHRASEEIIGRVMGSLSTETPSHAELGFPWPRIAIGFAAIAAVALLSVRVFRPPNEEPVPDRAAAPAPAPLNISIPQIPAAHFDQLTLHLDQPLEKELQNVISDTRVAIQFVAASFLHEK